MVKMRAARDRLHEKIPSVVGYEIESTRIVDWGSRYSLRGHKFEPFKLLLHQIKANIEFDELLGRLEAMSLQETRALPGSSALHLTAEFIRKLREYIFDTYGKTFPSNERISYVMAMPDLWPPQTQDLIRWAAVKAGFTGDIVLVDEFTACGVYCVTMCHGDLKLGSKFLGKYLLCKVPHS